MQSGLNKTLSLFQTPLHFCSHSETSAARVAAAAALVSFAAAAARVERWVASLDFSKSSFSNRCIESARYGNTRPLRTNLLCCGRPQERRRQRCRRCSQPRVLQPVPCLQSNRPSRSVFVSRQLCLCCLAATHLTFLSDTPKFAIKFSRATKSQSQPPFSHARATLITRCMQIQPPDNH